MFRHPVQLSSFHDIRRSSGRPFRDDAGGGRDRGPEPPPREAI
ncbi:hypothetical protein SLNHY_0452 [Streptomyces albus]|nr:hypothetical protein SLNHY_0452 [Streptomyces albus]